MLTLRDADTGRVTQVGTRGAIRLLIASDGAPDLQRLRALLVGDVLRRIADVAGVRVIVAADDRVPGRDALGIAPAQADPDAYAANPSTPADVAIGPGPGPDGAVRLDVAPLTSDGSPDVPPLATPFGDPGTDPAALRLAMLGAPYDHATDLTQLDLEAAGTELARWRGRVAAWAESPSRPMCADHVERFRAAFESGLDVPEALATLRLIENDPDIPPGAKFETFVFADRVLALELPREIGHA